ncbi:MAG: 3-oxoacyl-[acyl-carrier-protein] reductase [Roseburia sp.]|nr:3-oxoacyl-[acyl-carrier-protein] reductase [Roseburia sp.]
MLTGKTALVTGAAKGIGREIALTLARNGATVIVNYNGSKERAEAVVREITDNGGSAEAMQCDVADFAASEALVKAVLEKYKKVDILVNNAGVTRDNLIMRMSEEDYDTVVNTNLKGAFNMIKHLSRSFIKQRGGKIVNITSVSGVLGNAGQANYSASKAGLIGLTKSVARELASRGVNVNAVAPGFIDTDMTSGMAQEAREELSGMIPMGKIGSTADVANLVLFLAGSQSDYITGQVICVDGGMAI